MRASEKVMPRFKWGIARLIRGEITIEKKTRKRKPQLNACAGKLTRQNAVRTAPRMVSVVLKYLRRFSRFIRKR